MEQSKPKPTELPIDSTINQNVTIMDLPEEIICPIFALLPEAKRQKLRLVCSSWKSIYDEFFKIKMHIDNVNWVHLKSSELVRHATFKNWTRDYVLQNLEFPRHISTLEIVNTSIATTFYNLFPLLESCTNLKSLILGNLIETHPANAITDFKLKDFYKKSTKWYPNLEHFKFVDVWPTTRSGLGDFSKICCRPKSELLSFFFKSFRHTRLRHLEVARENSFWLLPVRMFFYENVAALEEDYRQMHLFTIPVIELGYEGLKKMQLTTYHSGLSTVQWEYCPESETEYPARQLSKFKKQIHTERSQTPKYSLALDKLFSHPVFEILMHQRNMKEVIYESWLDDEATSSKLSRVLGNNRETLEKLSIISRYPSPGPHLLDFIDLSCMLKLKYLSLSIKETEYPYFQRDYLIDDEEDDIPGEPMYNVSLSFPKTLHRLELHCPFYIDQINWQRIFGRLENLEHLKLFAGTSASSAWFHNRQGKVFIIKLDDIMSIVDSARLGLIEIFWPKLQPEKPKPNADKKTLMESRIHVDSKILEMVSMINARWKIKIDNFDNYKYRSFDNGYIDYRRLKIHVTRFE